MFVSSDGSEKKEDWEERRLSKDEPIENALERLARTSESILMYNGMAIFNLYSSEGRWIGQCYYTKRNAGT